MADARSIVALTLLCAAAHSSLDIEAFGDDEETAIRAVENFFVEQSRSSPTPPSA